MIKSLKLSALSIQKLIMKKEMLYTSQPLGIMLQKILVIVMGFVGMFKLSLHKGEYKIDIIDENVVCILFSYRMLQFVLGSVCIPLMLYLIH